MQVKVGTEGEMILEEVYNSIVLRCDQGDFGICMRDGGIVVMYMGEEVFNSKYSASTIELHSIAVVKDPPNPHCVIKGLAPGAKNTCALADPENWPCQWAISNYPHDPLGYHCPKTCDHIQIMKDGEAWSS